MAIGPDAHKPSMHVETDSISCHGLLKFLYTGSLSLKMSIRGLFDNALTFLLADCNRHTINVLMMMHSELKIRIKTISTYTDWIVVGAEREVIPTT